MQLREMESWGSAAWNVVDVVHLWWICWIFVWFIGASVTIFVINDLSTRFSDLGIPRPPSPGRDRNNLIEVNEINLIERQSDGTNFLTKTSAELNVKIFMTSTKYLTVKMFMILHHTKCYRSYKIDISISKMRKPSRTQHEPTWRDNFQN